MHRGCHLEKTVQTSNMAAMTDKQCLNECGLLLDRKAIVCSARLFVKSLVLTRRILVKWDPSIRCSIPRLVRSDTGAQTCFVEQTCRARIHPRPRSRQTHPTVQA